jgi:hypothetical protein
LRKNLRDTEPQRDEALKSIESTLGVGPWTFECDWAAIHSNVKPANWQDSLGSLMFKNWLPTLAEKVKPGKYNLDDEARKALIKATPTRKIVARLGAANTGVDPRVVFENGVLVMEQGPENFGTNAGSVASKLDTKLNEMGPDPELGTTLFLRQNLAANEPLRAQNLARIEKASGISGLTLEIDFPALQKQLDDSHSRHSLGTLFYENWLGNMATKLEKQLKDDMVREAFVDAVKSKKIRFEVGDGNGSDPKVYFEGGAMIVRQKANIFGVNSGSFCDNIHKSL